MSKSVGWSKKLLMIISFFLSTTDCTQYHHLCLHCGRKAYIHIEEEIEACMEMFCVDPLYYLAFECILGTVDMQSINRSFLVDIICNTENYLDKL